MSQNQKSNAKMRVRVDAALDRNAADQENVVDESAARKVQDAFDNFEASEEFQQQEKTAEETGNKILDDLESSTHDEDDVPE